MCNVYLYVRELNVVVVYIILERCVARRRRHLRTTVIKVTFTLIVVECHHHKLRILNKYTFKGR